MLLGQGGNDRADGGSEADYVEGGQGSDLVLGGTEDDDVVGGSSATSSRPPPARSASPTAPTTSTAAAGSDLAIGDNGLLTRVTTGRDWRTNRADATQTALVPGRGVTLFDLNGAGAGAADTAPLRGATRSPARPAWT